MFRNNLIQIDVLPKATNINFESYILPETYMIA